MRLRSGFLSHSVCAVVWVACCALLLTGCDSNGSSNSGSSGAGDASAFEVTIKNVGSPHPILKSGAFTPADVINDNNNVPPLEPGEAFEFSFTAGPDEIPNSGMKLSFASMFVQSNDVYYAFEPGGISLFDDNGTPIGQSSTANLTSELNLYDAGTEQDQEPGTGADQAPRQSDFGVGTDEGGTITRITENSNGTLEDDGFTYPDISNSVDVTVSSETDADGGYKFTVTIENVGSGDQVNGEPLLLSPGSYAVHWAQTPSGDAVTFPGHAPGSEATAGIERIAEDGRPGGADGVSGNHVETLAGKTGVTVPLSPGAVAVHSDEVSLFSTGEAASDGIEAIAEDGRPNGALDSDPNEPAGNLVASLTGTDGIQSVKAFGSGPITPGNSVTFSVETEEGDQLSFATMYVQSNDYFYAADGLSLFDDGTPISGDVTTQVTLYDAGTEVDQEAGVGLDQAPRQSALNTGTDENGNVEAVSTAPAGNVIEVTIDPPSAQ